MSLDINADPIVWADYNVDVFNKGVLKSQVAPWPPELLMKRVSGVTAPLDFAKQGREIFLALSRASPKPLSSYLSVLDFGVGSGRLARMFRGFKGKYTGVDVDHELVGWVGKALPWVTAVPSIARESIPAGKAAFDCVISISVFTHMNEVDSEFYLKDLHRVTAPGAMLFLTTHGPRSLHRALTEQRIFDMLCISEESIRDAKAKIDEGGFSFVIQNGHLTTEKYDYGMSFTSREYIDRVWSKYFRVIDVVESAIYDFQDIVVLERLPTPSLIDRIKSFFGR